VTDGTSGAAPAGGLRHALARAGASLLGLVRTRLELASVEYLEERERTLARLVLVAVAVLAFAFALLMASALVVVLFWDAHRVAALAAVALAYAAIGAVAWWRLKDLGRTAPAPFAATLAELERDGELLAEAFRDRANP
jgi:uncharacterized membrane protein YqjE